MIPKLKPIKSEKEFIKQSGLVQEDLNQEKPKWKNITLRISTAMLEEIDDMMKTKVGLTRNGWILQALDEKLRMHRIMDKLPR